MKDAPTRTDLEIVLAEVRRRQRELTVQMTLDIGFLESLKDKPLEPDVQVMLRYMVSGEPMRVSAWANDKGWKFKPPQGKRRDYKAADVLWLLSNPPEGWDREVIALVKSCCWDESGKFNTGKMMG